MRNGQIVRLAVAQKKKGADLLAWAFDHDPLYEMLIPEVPPTAPRGSIDFGTAGIPSCCGPPACSPS